MSRNNIIKYVFRALLGILFLCSATAKLVGIDAFELYLFGLGIFPLGTSYLLSRLVIAAEYTLGILLIANFYPRLAFWGTLLMLVGFTAFLAVLAATGNRDNCNCFGEWVNLNPVQSIWKNLGMLALLLLSAGIPAFQVKHKPLWLTLACVVPLATVLIVSEETGAISAAYGGNIERGLNAERIKERLRAIQNKQVPAQKQKARKFFSREKNSKAGREEE